MAENSGNRTMSVNSDRGERFRVAAVPQVRCCTMVWMLMITGCAGSMGTMHADPITMPVMSFDGAYRGTIRMTPSAGDAKGISWCQTAGQPVITVANGQFSYAVPHPNVPGNPTPSFQATMARDGSFSGQGNEGTISGNVHGTHMEGSIDGSGCIYAFTADRI